MSGIEFLTDSSCAGKPKNFPFTSVALSVEITGTSTWLAGTIGSPYATITGTYTASGEGSWSLQDFQRADPLRTPDEGYFGVAQYCCAKRPSVFFGTLTLSGVVTIACECESTDPENHTNCEGYPVSSTFDLRITLALTESGGDTLRFELEAARVDIDGQPPACSFGGVGLDTGGTSDPIAWSDIAGGHSMEFTSHAASSGTDAPYPGDYSADLTADYTITFS